MMRSEASVLGLAELFNPDGDEIVTVTELAMLALSPYKRRAFILAVVELVSQILLHKFRNQRSAQIRITLERQIGRKALFRIEDAKYCIEASLPATSISIVSRLTHLLEAEVIYRRPHLGASKVEFFFPI
jgi:hypothetical protein